jgi:hypothetical protein
MGAKTQRAFWFRSGCENNFFPSDVSISTRVSNRGQPGQREPAFCWQDRPRKMAKELLLLRGGRRSFSACGTFGFEKAMNSNLAHHDRR